MTPTCTLTKAPFFLLQTRTVRPAKAMKHLRVHNGKSLYHMQAKFRRNFRDLEATKPIEHSSSYSIRESLHNLCHTASSSARCRRLPLRSRELRPSSRGSSLSIPMLCAYCHRVSISCHSRPSQRRLRRLLSWCDIALAGDQQCAWRRGLFVGS